MSGVLKRFISNFTYCNVIYMCEYHKVQKVVQKLGFDPGAAKPLGSENLWSGEAAREQKFMERRSRSGAKIYGAAEPLGSENPRSGAVARERKVMKRNQSGTRMHVLDWRR